MSWITLASLVYAVGFNWCYAPNQIGFGGITGVGQILNAHPPWAPIGTVVILLNIPSSSWGGSPWAGTCWVTSLYAMFVSSLFIDVLIARFSLWSPCWPHFRRRAHGRLPWAWSSLQGATTGGTDLMARLLKLKLAWLPMGGRFWR